jgi:hypothetical protein
VEFLSSEIQSDRHAFLGERALDTRLLLEALDDPAQLLVAAAREVMHGHQPPHTCLARDLGDSAVRRVSRAVGPLGVGPPDLVQKEIDPARELEYINF